MMDLTHIKTKQDLLRNYCDICYNKIKHYKDIYQLLELQQIYDCKYEFLYNILMLVALRINDLESAKYIIAILNHPTSDMIFIEEQDETELDDFKRLINKNNTYNLDITYNTCLDMAFKNNNMEMAKWLWDIVGDKRDFNFQNHIQFAIMHNGFEHAKWLIDCAPSLRLAGITIKDHSELSTIFNIHENEDFCMRWAYTHKNYDMANWLLSLQSNNLPSH